MCLAVPLKIVELNTDKTSAVAERDGVRRTVNVSFIKEPRIGEYVIVHAGFAIERIAQKQAEDVMSSYRELMDELAELNGLNVPNEDQKLNDQNAGHKTADIGHADGSFS